MKKLLFSFIFAFVIIIGASNTTFGEETTEEITTQEESTTEEPTSEEPTSEEPTSEEPTSEEPTTEEPTSEEPTTEEPEPEKTVRVLFVGNSFTRSGGTDIGEMLEKIAVSQNKNLETDVIKNPGFYLSYYTNSYNKYFEYHVELINALRDNEYDYVVLQESSFGCIEDTEGMIEAIDKIRDYVQYYQADAEILLYMTHPFEDGATLEIDNQEVILSTPERLTYTQAAYVYAGKKLDLKVVMAGVGFYRCLKAFPEIRWYNEDNKHPLYTTFYSMACSFYRQIYGEQPNVEDNPIDILELTGEEQQNIANISYNTLSFKEAYKVLGEGEAYQLTAVFEADTEEKISWSSLDNTVATVKDGVITAKGKGSTVIVGRTSSGSQAVCCVTVEDANIKSKGISFINSKHVLEIGEKLMVIPQVSIMLRDNKIRWSVSGKNVAKVDSKGVVTALAPGRAKIIVTDTKTGKSASYYVYVRNKAPINVKASNVVVGKGAKASMYIKISWKKSTDATYYIVYRSEAADGTYKKIAKTDKVSYTDKTVKRNKMYYYKITAYKSNVICESDKSNKVKVIALAAPKVSVVSNKKNTIKIKWNKNNYATGYIIYRSVGNSKSYKKVATIKSKTKVTFTDKNVKAKKTYYYSVKAYRKIGDKTYYSNRLAGIKVKYK
ncbi:MAG: Ig-like domain-containing protein [Lachnospiraceae bacterium]|nr:Ig-like domain-containing protein [Lachnospiraceae bacterium]